MFRVDGHGLGAQDGTDVRLRGPPQGVQGARSAAAASSCQTWVRAWLTCRWCCLTTIEMLHRHLLSGMAEEVSEHWPCSCAAQQKPMQQAWYTAGGTVPAAAGIHILRRQRWQNKCTLSSIALCRLS